MAETSVIVSIMVSSRELDLLAVSNAAKLTDARSLYIVFYTERWERWVAKACSSFRRQKPFRQRETASLYSLFILSGDSGVPRSSRTQVVVFCRLLSCLVVKQYLAPARANT